MRLLPGPIPSPCPQHITGTRPLHRAGIPQFQMAHDTSSATVSTNDNTYQWTAKAGLEPTNSPPQNINNSTSMSINRKYTETTVVSYSKGTKTTSVHDNAHVREAPPAMESLLAGPQSNPYHNNIMGRSHVTDHI